MMFETIKQYGSMGNIGHSFNLPTQWCSKGGGKWGHAPRTHQHT